MNRIPDFEKRGKLFWVVVGLVLTAAVGFADFLTGYEIAFSLFYLVPVFLVTWFAGRQLGLVISTASGFAWLIADVVSGHTYSHPAMYYWNAAVRLGFFIIVTELLAALQRSLEREREVVRADYMTGAVNRRFFFDLLEMEMVRSHRYKHPFVVAYVDLDSLKAVNDELGHSVGDQVLCAVVKSVRAQLRKTDTVARLGGDEFAILLPETGAEAARVTISKIHSSLLKEMREKGWDMTFSIGVLTCLTPPRTAEEVIRQTDELMYAVKNGGKNAINYAVYAG